MLSWFKQKDDAALLDRLERIAVVLDGIRDRMEMDQKSVEERIYRSVKDRLMKELIREVEEIQKRLFREAGKPVQESCFQQVSIRLDGKREKERVYNPVLQLLEENGVRMIKYSQDHSKYAHLTGLIQHMGDKFEEVAKLVKQLKISLNSSKKKRICLRNWSDAEISSSCQLALSLFNNGLLEDYKYLRSPLFEMIFQTSRNPDAINFLTGDWLECYVRSLVERHLRLQGVEYSLAANPFVMLPNGRQFEMDLLIKAAGDLIWIEIKSGEYKSYLTKYEEIGRLLQIPPKNRFLILANEQEAVCESLGRSRQMNVLNLNMLKREMPSIVRTLSSEIVRAG